MNAASYNIYDTAGVKRPSIIHKPAQQLVDAMRLRLTQIDLALMEVEPDRALVDCLLDQNIALGEALRELNLCK